MWGALRQGKRIACLALWALALALPAPLWAHNETVESRPRPGEILDRSPEWVAIDFEGPLAPGSFIQVIDEAFQRVDVGATELLPLESGGGMRVAVPVLKPGGYTAQWTVVDAQDGHSVRGSFTFSLKAPASFLASARGHALGEWIMDNLHILAGGWVLKLVLTVLVVRWLTRRRAARKAALAAAALWEDER